MQLAAGEGPDIARVTDLGGLNKFYLDLAPHLGARAKYWEDNFGTTLPWLRGGPADKGIYGMMTQLTVTGAFVNKTLFEQAKVPMPGAKATWDEWADATRKVAAATKTPFAMAMDRSGHRFAPLAVAMGAKIFDANGAPVIDDGYRTAVRKVRRLESQRPDAEGSVGRRSAARRTAMRSRSSPTAASCCTTREAGR